MTQPSSRSTPRGLQAERTALSWTRTSLGLLANGALLLFRAHQTGRPVLTVALSVLAAVAAAYVAIGARRRNKELLAHEVSGRTAVGGRLLTLTALVTGLAVLTGILLTV